MKIFEVHRRAIRLVSLIVMATYIAAIILSTRYAIGYILGIGITFLAMVATVAQFLTCIKNLEKESDCNGNNGVMQGLLIWIMIFAFTFGMI